MKRNPAISMTLALLLTASLCACQPQTHEGDNSSQSTTTGLTTSTSTSGTTIFTGSSNGSQTTGTTTLDSPTTTTMATTTKAADTTTTAKATTTTKKLTNGSGGSILEGPEYDANLMAEDGSYIKDGEAGWTMDWSDDFNGTKLNGNIWKKQAEANVNSLLQNTDPFRNIPIEVSHDTVSLDGMGNLKVGILQQEDGTYLQGGIESQRAYDRTYGYFEMRCIQPKTECAIAAFWSMPRAGFVTNEPTGGMEVDIFETAYWRRDFADGKFAVGLGTILNGSISQGVHWGGYGSTHRSTGANYYPADKKDTGAGLYDDYHVYGLKWTEDTMRFYVDGKLSFETKGNGNGVSQIAQYIIISTGVNSWAGGNITNITVPSNLTVDWVRVYKNSKYQAS